MNPDISVIPRFLLQTDDSKYLSEGKREFSRPDFSLDELEFGIQSALNPYARADIFVSLSGPDLDASSISLEEAYATILKGLPFDLNVRLGKYRVEYGKINMIHPHAWSFVTEPLSQQRFLGDDGLNDLGISASILLPTGDVYTRFTVDILRGGSVGNAAGIPDTTGEVPFYANTARLMTFLSLTDYSDLELGLSTFTGIHDPYNRERFWYLNGDFKYKYRPSAYTSLTLQGEYLFNTRNASQNRTLVPFLDASGSPERRQIKSSGLYAFADYQFMKVFSVGARYDWSESPYSAQDKANAVSIFLGYYPVEETLGFRLQYQHTTTQAPGISQSVNSIGLEILLSLGPHKAHPF